MSEEISRKYTKQPIILTHFSAKSAYKIYAVCNQISVQRKKEDNIMGTLAIIIMYGAIIGVISVVAYFVIKSAVKAALKEFEEEKRHEKN